MRFKNPSAAKEQINASVPAEMKRRLQALSLHFQRSESALARQAIECWIGDREHELGGRERLEKALEEYLKGEKAGD